MIIGAGVVGLAIARYFSVELGWSCLIVEREDRFGLGVSSRNSEVIHSGLYYPPGSLKAQLCVDGNDRLYHYLERNSLPYRKCGKYILAAEGAESALDDLYDQGIANGVADLERLPPGGVQAVYAELSAGASLYCPGTGILSADALMTHLAGEYQANGGDLALQTTFEGMRSGKDHFLLDLRGADGEKVDIQTERVINSAGLQSFDLARLAGFDYTAAGYELRLCKGSYFSVQGARGMFEQLIYPLPSEVGLGIHLRLDLQGELRLGPDTEYLTGDTPEYTVDEKRKGLFLEAVAAYWPGIAERPIVPDWAGVRPHIYQNGQHHKDFIIRAESDSGYPNWINMLGIDSPGLTAALAFGPTIAQLWGLEA